MTVRILRGDCRDVLKTLPDESVHCVVTSPPYFALRDYGVAGQMGLEATPEAFIEGMVEVFREVRRVLRDDGTLWLNIGDTYATSGGPGWQGKNGTRADRRFTGTRNTVPMREQTRTAYAGHKPKDMLGMPWMLAFALRADGWYLRQDIIWSKPNPMPESVSDRCTKAHEYIFLLSKSERYFYDQDAILEPVSPNTHARVSQDVERQVGSARAHAGGKTNGKMKAVLRSPKIQPDRRDGVKNNASFANACALLVEKRNKRSVWTVTTRGFKEAHFATFPPALIEPCILAGAPRGGGSPRPFRRGGHDRSGRRSAWA